MSAVYNMAADYYRRGLWPRERLDKLVEAGKLTRQEMEQITGEVPV